MIELIQTIDYKTIYEDMEKQFPPEELNTCAGFSKTACLGDYNLYFALCNNQKVGYVTLFSDKENNTLWLDYFAIFKEFHSCGYGQKILNAMKETFKEYYGCWLEVEKPDEKIPNTIRRINFYKKAGAILTDCKYIYPTCSGKLPMDLYFLPFKENFNPQSDMILSCIDRLFKVVHHEKPYTKKIFEQISSNN